MLIYLNHFFQIVCLKGITTILYANLYTGKYALLFYKLSALSYYNIASI